MTGQLPTWVLESGVFHGGDDALADAVQRAGGQVIEWSDEWLDSDKLPTLPGPVIFRGSLANADWLAQEGRWHPGAFCATERFACSYWHPSVQELLLTPRSVLMSVADIVTAGPPSDFGDRVFVRPDSALKPFSGRVLGRDQISLRSLDHGFYYDDENLPIVVCPVVDVGAEWRLVVVDGAVVAGSGYDADGRTAGAPLNPNHPAWVFGQSIIESLPTLEAVFVVDIGEGHDGFRLIELNPFSGADLYGCDRRSIVDAIHLMMGY